MRNWQIAILFFALAFGLVLSAAANFSAAKSNPAVDYLVLFGAITFVIGLSALAHWFYQG